MPKYISIAGLIACVCLLAYISFRIISPSIKPTPQGDHKNYTQPQPPNEKLYGLTIDDGWYDALPVSDVVTGIKQLPVKPTVRIVMSKDRTPQSYIALFKAIHSVADIMAQPVDSFDLQSYSVDQYRQRFETSYQYLSQYTSIWEIGNEINSDWIREDPNQITEKIAAAYRLIKNKHGIAALTPYYFPPNEGTLPMEDWLKKYIPDDMKQDLDYVLVSYYEDDNDGYQPHWKQIFTRLETLFPHAKLGIGECGNTSDNATPVSKSAMFRRYYSMPRYTSRYIGGYFWWYWVQDSITYKNNTLWQETANSMRR